MIGSANIMHRISVIQFATVQSMVYCQNDLILSRFTLFDVRHLDEATFAGSDLKGSIIPVTLLHDVA